MLFSLFDLPIIGPLDIGTIGQLPLICSIMQKQKTTKLSVFLRARHSIRKHWEHRMVLNIGSIIIAELRVVCDALLVKNYFNQIQNHENSCYW
jgi:hypothetical protein